ncbi:FAD-dependent oxidoreductase [Flavobacterium sp.]|uniref:FAD-dependent oxidoreductase n=1 Tax=Flavobacterium sp. TaxID=239 RepID=UPI003D0E0BC5
MQRRNFLKLGFAGLLLTQFPALLTACKEKTIQIIFKLTGANAVLGHRLWSKDFPKPSKTVEIPILIIGGGIAGLSAGRRLLQRGIRDFQILEMEQRIGGNSGYGSNSYSQYPLGAHYLPLPNPEDRELLAFLEEAKIITHYENGLAVFDEEQLCADPKERLFIHNTWQEDLIPKYGISDDAEKEFHRFFARVKELREEKDNLGKYYFDIPIKNVSQNPKYKYLDNQTMAFWLKKNQFYSEELLAYVDYCCRDDFGLGIEAISAWAGLFYFCARKNHAYQSDAVLTWPEGNGRLLKHLRKSLSPYLVKQHLAYDVKCKDNSVEVLVFDEVQKTSIRYKAQKVICATPQFVNQYLIEGRKELASHFEYAPWFTATIVLKDAFYNDTFPLCWDNVIYKSKGLGYVYNQHQEITQIHDKKVITYYYSFSDENTKLSRRRLYKLSEDALKKIIIEDLSIAHPYIEASIEHIAIYRLGHGMISPKPNFITGHAINMARENIQNKIFFAHSDLSGLSIFEEAFHQGITAANQIEYS